MQQRYYDPVARRFLSIDPVVTDANTGAGFNIYEYAKSNPYRYLDPDGRASECAKQKGGCSSGQALEEASGAASVAAAVSKGADDLVTGGYGAKFDQALSERRWAGAAGNLAAGTIFGVMNVLTLGEGTAAMNAAKVITASEIRGINQAFGGINELTGKAETVVSNMAYREGAGAKAATAIRDIAGSHLFNDANKRTAQAVAERLLGSSADSAKIRSVIDSVANGSIRNVEDITNALGH